MEENKIDDIKNDLKTVLYVKARMDDLRMVKENNFNDFFLVSNTSFSKDAIKFAGLYDGFSLYNNNVARAMGYFTHTPEGFEPGSLDDKIKQFIRAYDKGYDQIFGVDDLERP